MHQRQIGCKPNRPRYNQNMNAALKWLKQRDANRWYQYADDFGRYSEEMRLHSEACAALAMLPSEVVAAAEAEMARQLTLLEVG